MIIPAKLPHFVQIAEDGVPEFFLDHTILSAARMCEAKMVLDHVNLYSAKGLKPWALAYGSLVHECMEKFYGNQILATQGQAKDLEFKEFLEFCCNLWREQRFDRYGQWPQYKAINGFMGFSSSMAQYYHYYMQCRTNLKPIALEIPFGKNKEVPILTDFRQFSWAPFRLYLSGRVDFIFDDTKRIGPLDHKTFSVEGKNPYTQYEVQEGMTGYIYAMQYVYKNHFAHLVDRATNVLWLNFILTKPQQDLNKKFQRSPLFKTEYQLEQWRLRQISTAAKIYQLLFEGRPPDFNGGVCTNYFHGTCVYQPVHRLPNANDQVNALARDFVILENGWNPEAI